jgi:hypothetical protein
MFIFNPWFLKISVDSPTAFAAGMHLAVGQGLEEQ